MYANSWQKDRQRRAYNRLRHRLETASIRHWGERQRLDHYLETLMAQDLADGLGFCFIDKNGDSAKRIAEKRGGSPTRIGHCSLEPIVCSETAAWR
jgi:hypothetical protein